MVDQPAVKSFFDVDFYKITMGQFAWSHHPYKQVTYEFKNRHANRVKTAKRIDEAELRGQITHAQQLRPSKEELEFLRETGLFYEEFLEFLRNIELPSPTIRRVDGQYEIIVEGEWQTAIYWETMILSIVNELLNRTFVEKEKETYEEVKNRGLRRLHEKLDNLDDHGVSGLVDFGTRRRFSADWHKTVLTTTVNAYPDLLGATSNVHFAHTLGLTPVGTFAHEMPMAYAAMAEPEGEEAMRTSQERFLDEWYAMYGHPLSIALTDTFGDDFFFSFMGKERLRRWKGLRHDSGNPFEWTNTVLATFYRLGLPPSNKLLLFSDGVTPDSIKEISDTIPEAQTGFGWGTNLTNDVGYSPTSMVVKLTAINGRRTVKLSNNYAKATGPEEKVKWYARVFGHSGANYQELTY